MPAAGPSAAEPDAPPLACAAVGRALSAAPCFFYCLPIRGARTAAAACPACGAVVAVGGRPALLLLESAAVRARVRSVRAAAPGPGPEAPLVVSFIYLRPMYFYL